MTTSRPVVLAYADDVAASNALAAALREAKLRDASLTVIHQLIGTEVPERDSRHSPRIEERRATIDRIGCSVTETAPDFDRVDVRVVTHSIAQELLVASKSASLVVVGATTRHAALAAAFDTVPHDLLRRAHCPVLLVPAESEEWSGAKIVCGIDRSEPSAAALSWAAQEAARRGVVVQAVEILRKKPARLLDAADPNSLQSWVRANVPQSATTVVCATEVGHARRRLLEIASAAHGLLVIGAHEGSGCRPTSVGRAVTAQTQVPVVVVPVPDAVPVISVTSSQTPTYAR